jgi:CRISPR/Cas system type I-B associated protein Csh2 (Cas7 group RAMP superfamily)
MRKISHILLTRTFRFWLEARVESSDKVRYMASHVAHPEGWLSNASFNKNEEISMHISTNYSTDDLKVGLIDKRSTNDTVFNKKKVDYAVISFRHSLNEILAP